MLEKLMESPFAWAFLSIITIVSLGYSMICNHRNKEKLEFSYCLKSNSLIRKKKSKFEKLSIEYDGQQIDDLCVSKFTVWNSGNKTINCTDIVESKELTVSVNNECRVLDVELIACSEKTNNFLVEIEDEHTVKIPFEYVDKKEGVVIQIIHTGTDEDIQIDCKIKGGKPVKNIVNEVVPRYISKAVSYEGFEKASIVIFGAMIAVVFGMSILFTISIFSQQLQVFLFSTSFLAAEHTREVQMSAIGLSVTLFICSIICCAMYIPLIKKVFNMGIPKKLKVYSDIDLSK